jgi:hypothetical protein
MILDRAELPTVWDLLPYWRWPVAASAQWRLFVDVFFEK